MKMDKETLLKNRFWIGLGAFVLTWLIVFIVIEVSGGSEVEKHQKKFDGAKNSLKGITNPKNEKFTEPLEVKRKKLEGQKDIVWEQAWTKQSDLMTWPGISSAPHLKAKGNFGEEISYQDRQDFYKKEYYQKQYEGLQDRVKPVKGNWDQLIRRVNFKVDVVPSSEEIWYVQEELWVQRELLEIVRNVLDSVGRFESLADMQGVDVPADEEKPREPPAAASPPAPAGTPPAPPAMPEDKPKDRPPLIHKRFRNPLWQLDLFFGQNDKKEFSLSPLSTLTNVGSDRQEQTVAGHIFQLKPSGSFAGVPLAFADKPEEKLGFRDSLWLKKPVPLPGFKPGTSVMVDVRGPAFDPPGPGLVRRRFRSLNWELDLILDPGTKNKPIISPKSTIRNINLARRPLRLDRAEFQVKQGEESGGPTIIIGSEPLAFNRFTEIGKAVDIGAFDPSRPIQVQQVFNDITSPIKQIEKMELYAPSHKTSPLPLKSALQFAKSETGTESGTPQPGYNPFGGPGGPSTAPSGGSSPPDQSSNMMMKMMMGKGGSQGPMGQEAAKNPTPNYHLERDRYLYVSPQVRRMPVGMSLIVDQAYIQDVLTAFANSRLRVQITQVQWQRRDAIPPMASGGSTPVSGGMMGPPPSPSPSYGGAIKPSMGGATDMTTPTPGRPPLSGSPGPGGPGFPGTTHVEEEYDPNLMELAVYGVASLYERPKPPTPPGSESSTSAPKPN